VAVNSICRGPHLRAKANRFSIPLDVGAVARAVLSALVRRVPAGKARRRHAMAWHVAGWPPSFPPTGAVAPALVPCLGLCWFLLGVGVSMPRCLDLWSRVAGFIHLNWSCQPRVMLMVTHHVPSIKWHALYYMTCAVLWSLREVGGVPCPFVSRAPPASCRRCLVRSRHSLARWR
jgi:hypothetical protein